MIDIAFYAGAALIGLVACLIPVEDKVATSKLGYDLDGLEGNDGLMLSKGTKLKSNACYEHIGIIGPTGAGKTTSMIIPNLLNPDLINCSIVVSDPKGELYEKTSVFQKSHGREPILFEPLAGDKICYNPLAECKDITEVRSLAECILTNGALALEIASGKKSGGMEWIQMSVPLLTASMLYCRDKGEPYNNIVSAFNLIVNASSPIELDILFSQAKEDVQKQFKIFNASLESPKTMSCIKVTLLSNMQLFTDPKIMKSTRKTDFTAKHLREKPTVLYVSYPERESNYLSPFSSIFYSQLINKTMDYYTDESLPIFFLWDEFANIGQLQGFAQNIATARSRKLSFVICLQSLTQLKQLYGDDNALSILNNLKTKVVYPAIADIYSLNYFSDLCGWKEIKVNNKPERKKLLEPDEIRRLGKEDVLVIAHNKYPVIDGQEIYYKSKRYTKYL